MDGRSGLPARRREVGPVNNDNIDTSWMADAACKGQTAIFYPEDGGTTDAARAICAECPVSHKCFSYSARTEERHGVWAGQLLSDRAIPRPKYVRPIEPIKHGTSGGYLAHKRRGTPICDECRIGRRLYEKAHKNRATA